MFSWDQKMHYFKCYNGITTFAINNDNDSLVNIIYIYSGRYIYLENSVFLILYLSCCHPCIHPEWKWFVLEQSIGKYFIDCKVVELVELDALMILNSSVILAGASWSNKYEF